MKLLPSNNTPSTFGRKFSVKGVDLTNNTQKLFAAGLVGGVGFLTYKALPVLLSFATNLLMLTGIGIGLLVLFIWVFTNYSNIWSFFKNLAWRTTKFMISKDSFGYMNRYVDWLAEQVNGIKNSIIELGSIKKTMAEKVQNCQDEMSELIMLHDKNPNDKLTLDKIGLNKDLLTSYIPDIEMVKTQIIYLTELAEFMDSDKNSLMYSINYLEERYELAKQLNIAITGAEKYVGKDNQRYKEFIEAKKQLGNKLNHYVSRYEAFQRDFQPILENARNRKDVKTDVIKQYIEDFKNNRETLDVETSSDETILIEGANDTFTPKLNTSIPTPQKVSIRKNNEINDLLNYNPND
jgi:hypothetical protein